MKKEEKRKKEGSGKERVNLYIPIIFMAALHLEETVMELCERLGYEFRRALYSDPRGDIAEIHAANRNS